MIRIAFYPGSFDPPMKGYEDLVRRSFALADQVIVVIVINGVKQLLFIVEECFGMLRDAVGSELRVVIQSFDGLLVEFAKHVGASIIVRGLRAVSDFEYEFQMALMNRWLHFSLEMVFLVPVVDFIYLSSSLVCEVARFGGDVGGLVHPAVAVVFVGRFR